MASLSSRAGVAAWRNNPALHNTFGYYLLFICLGVSTAILGPTLPTLAAQTGVPVESMGMLLLGGSIGYTLGTFLGGRLYSRLPGHRLLGSAQIAAALCIACLPLAPWFWLLLAIVFCRGLAEGLINTGGNTLLVWTHGEKVSPFMNGLHFFFGSGAFLAPLLVARLMPLTDGYRWAYWALALLGLLAGGRVLTLGGSPQPQHAGPAAGGATSTIRAYLPLISMATLFLFFYVGAEISFGNWIYTYTTTLGVIGEAGAAYLNAAFWLSFTIGRLISIPAATRFTPRQVIPVALAGGLCLLAVMILAPRSTAVLWAVTIGLGFCMAPVWPTGFTLAGQVIPMTAFASSMILLGDSLGGMVLPSLAGWVIKAVGVQSIQFSLPLLVFGSLAGTGLAFMGMLVKGKRMARS